MLGAYRISHDIAVEQLVSIAQVISPTSLLIDILAKIAILAEGYFLLLLHAIAG